MAALARSRTSAGLADGAANFVEEDVARDTTSTAPHRRWARVARLPRAHNDGQVLRNNITGSTSGKMGS